MNTEFPSRIPTVVNSQSNSATLASSTSSDASFQKNVLDVFNTTIKFLKSITDKVSNLSSGQVKSKANKKTTAKNKEDEETRQFQVNTFDILKSTTATLNNLTNIVSDFIDNKLPKLFDTKVKSNKTDPSATNQATLNLVSHRFTDSLDSIKNMWKSGIESLQNTVESVSSSIGDAIGGIFGSGIFGRMMSKIITKALSFAVGKILVGMVVSNLPMILIGGAIIAAITALVYFSKEIWDAIKWLGYALDQGIDAIIDILPWGTSKYKEAREELAKDVSNAYGINVSEEDILDMYGDTVRGRNQAYEDFKLAYEDEDAYLDVLEKIKAYKKGELEEWEKNKKESFQISGSPSTINDFSGAANDLDAIRTANDLDLDIKSGAGDNNNINVSPVTQTTVNNTSVNNIGNNVSNSKSITSLNPNNQQYGLSLM